MPNSKDLSVEDEAYISAVSAEPKMTMDEVGADIETHGYVPVEQGAEEKNPLTAKSALSDALGNCLSTDTDLTEDKPFTRDSHNDMDERLSDPTDDPRDETKGDVEGATDTPQNEYTQNQVGEPTVQQDSAVYVKDSLADALESITMDGVEGERQTENKEMMEKYSEENGSVIPQKSPDIPEALGGSSDKPDKNGLVYVTAVFTVDPNKYVSNNYRPAQARGDIKNAAKIKKGKASLQAAMKGGEGSFQDSAKEQAKESAMEPDEPNAKEEQAAAAEADRQQEIAENKDGAKGEKKAEDESPEKVVLDYSSFVDGSSFMCFDDVASIDYTKIAMDAGPRKKVTRENCETTFDQCRAQNPLFCRFHGPKLLEMDIKTALKATCGPGCTVSVTKDKGAPNKFTFRLTVGCPPSKKDMVQKVVDMYMTQQPGITSAQTEMKKIGASGGKDALTQEFEMDILKADQPPKKGKDDSLEAVAQGITKEYKDAGKTMPVVKETPNKIVKAANAAEQVQGEEEGGVPEQGNAGVTKPEGMEEAETDTSTETPEAESTTSEGAVTEGDVLDFFGAAFAKGASKQQMLDNFMELANKGTVGGKDPQGFLKPMMKMIQNRMKVSGADHPMTKALAKAGVPLPEGMDGATSGGANGETNSKIDAGLHSQIDKITDPNNQDVTLDDIAQAFNALQKEYNALGGGALTDVFVDAVDTMVDPVGADAIYDFYVAKNNKDIEGLKKSLKLLKKGVEVYSTYEDEDEGGGEGESSTSEGAVTEGDVLDFFGAAFAKGASKQQMLDNFMELANKGTVGGKNPKGFLKPMMKMIQNRMKVSGADHPMTKALVNAGVPMPEGMEGAESVGGESKGEKSKPKDIYSKPKGGGNYVHSSSGANDEEEFDKLVGEAEDKKLFDNADFQKAYEGIFFDGTTDMAGKVAAMKELMAKYNGDGGAAKKSPSGERVLQAPSSMANAKPQNSGADASSQDDVLTQVAEALKGTSYEGAKLSTKQVKSYVGGINGGDAIVIADTGEAQLVGHKKKNGEIAYGVLSDNGKAYEETGAQSLESAIDIFEKYYDGKPPSTISSTKDHFSELSVALGNLKQTFAGPAMTYNHDVQKALDNADYFAKKAEQELKSVDTYKEGIAALESSDEVMDAVSKKLFTEAMGHAEERAIDYMGQMEDAMAEAKTKMDEIVKKQEDDEKGAIADSVEGIVKGISETIFPDGPVDGMDSVKDMANSFIDDAEATIKKLVGDEVGDELAKNHGLPQHISAVATAAANFDIAMDSLKEAMDEGSMKEVKSAKENVEAMGEQMTTEFNSLKAACKAVKEEAEEMAKLNKAKEQIAKGDDGAEVNNGETSDSVKEVSKGDLEDFFGEAFDEGDEDEQKSLQIWMDMANKGVWGSGTAKDYFESMGGWLQKLMMKKGINHPVTQAFHKWGLNYPKGMETLGEQGLDSVLSSIDGGLTASSSNTIITLDKNSSLSPEEAEKQLKEKLEPLGFGIKEHKATSDSKAAFVYYPDDTKKTGGSGDASTKGDFISTVSEALKETPFEGIELSPEKGTALSGDGEAVVIAKNKGKNLVAFNDGGSVQYGVVGDDGTPLQEKKPSLDTLWDYFYHGDVGKQNTTQSETQSQGGSSNPIKPFDFAAWQQEQKAGTQQSTARQGGAKSKPSLTDEEKKKKIAAMTPKQKLEAAVKIFKKKLSANPKDAEAKAKLKKYEAMLAKLGK